MPIQYAPEDDAASAQLPSGEVVVMSRRERSAPGTFKVIDKKGRDRAQEAVAGGLIEQFLDAADQALVSCLSSINAQAEIDEDALVDEEGLFVRARQSAFNDQFSELRKRNPEDPQQPWEF